MAKRRTVAAGKTELVVVNAGGGVQRRRSSGGGIRRRRSSGGGKRRRSSSSSGGSIQSSITGMATGGFAYGQLVKNFPNMPTIPGIGRAGTVAVIGYFMKPKAGLIKNTVLAAAVIAGYSFGSTGTVAGDDDEVISG